MLTQSLELALSVIHVITERHCIKCVHIILITIEVTAQLLNCTKYFLDCTNNYFSCLKYLYIFLIILYFYSAIVIQEFY